MHPRVLVLCLLRFFAAIPQGEATLPASGTKSTDMAAPDGVQAIPGTCSESREHHPCHVATFDLLLSLLSPAQGSDNRTNKTFAKLVVAVHSQMLLNPDFSPGG